MSDTEVILVDPDAIDRAKPNTFYAEGSNGEQLTDPMLWESGITVMAKVLKQGIFVGYRISSTGELISACHQGPVAMNTGDTVQVSINAGPCR